MVRFKKPSVCFKTDIYLMRNVYNTIIMFRRENRYYTSTAHITEVCVLARREEDKILGTI